MNSNEIYETVRHLRSLFNDNTNSKHIVNIQSQCQEIDIELQIRLAIIDEECTNIVDLKARKDKIFAEYLASKKSEGES